MVHLSALLRWERTEENQKASLFAWFCGVASSAICSGVFFPLQQGERKKKKNKRKERKSPFADGFEHSQQQNSSVTFRLRLVVFYKDIFMCNKGT